ncbi:hypothetical protein CcI6DRAFT_00445 [Frankia sp. CcI6]|uniref:hypothetical protein n=1 Tax=Frankia TaxID=1854 RepID=UPI0003CFC350|nr:MULTISPECIES: hypothetical protein [Frankia]ETA04229.1 hypothetical protein CcI6DRAFT_00445 [Frankia sp. CcI6]KDA44553.1 hypothetical protein BMG523Draft_00402 [Frankia sp. BMG5.23]KFB05556.1 hypothetical protein ALLO2DRAFT_01507 [Frankia sp. Allo2]OAA27671.1 hypothetical protein AAY23_102284 [Frankia casuarinae]
MPRYYVRTSFGFGWWVAFFWCLYLSLFLFSEASAAIPFILVAVIVIAVIRLVGKAMW